MTAEEYEQLPPEEKKHFAKCSEAGKSLIGKASGRCLWPEWWNSTLSKRFWEPLSLDNAGHRTLTLI
jgi:hypothetical protein